MVACRPRGCKQLISDIEQGGGEDPPNFVHTFPITNSRRHLDDGGIIIFTIIKVTSDKSGIATRHAP